MSRRLIDLTGMRFGKLTVIKRASDYIAPKGKTTTRWLCKCDCGNTCEVRTDLLRNGYTKSCGCIVATQGRLTQTRPELSHIWGGMLRRCYDESIEAYPRYGGRGITVCEEWKNSLSNFCNWAETHGYQKGLSIDRVDFNGNYCPENCRWADIKTQNNNKSDTHHVTYAGETHTYSEWADIMGLGLTRDIIYSRIQRNGWDEIKAITTPARRQNRKGV
nr:MAG TPA: hypothetical protein [Caudoviricetes sp.]